MLFPDSGVQQLNVSGTEQESTSVYSLTPPSHCQGNNSKHRLRSALNLQIHSELCLKLFWNFKWKKNPGNNGLENGSR